MDRGIKSLLGVPLFADGEVIGVLHVGSVTGRSFGTDDAELLQLASERASRAVHSLMAREAVEAALAHIEPDTLSPREALEALYRLKSLHQGAST